MPPSLQYDFFGRPRLESLQASLGDLLLHRHVDELRRLIDARLTGYLDAETVAPVELLAALRYSLLGPGKRLRPVLVLLAAQACGGPIEPALAAACAVEMVHAYSLVHDDLPAMDDDDFRRGRPSCHKQFNEATAILVGDALLSLAFQVLAQDVRPGSLAADCCRELARAAGVAGMVGGQMDDLAQEQSRQGNVETLQAIHARKTGALFRAALRLGGMIGIAQSGGNPVPDSGVYLEALDRFGQCFGLAFQISDDLLDVEGDADRTGKKVRKDAKRGKLTYPGLLGAAESRRRLHLLCGQAQEQLAPFGERGRYLAELVERLATRDR